MTTEEITKTLTTLSLFTDWDKVGTLNAGLAKDISYELLKKLKENIEKELK